MITLKLCCLSCLTFTCTFHAIKNGLDVQRNILLLPKIQAWKMHMSVISALCIQGKKEDRLLGEGNLPRRCIGAPYSPWVWMSQKGREYLQIVINTFSSALLYLLWGGRRGHLCSIKIFFFGALSNTNICMCFTEKHGETKVLQDLWFARGWMIWHPHEWPLQPVSPYNMYFGVVKLFQAVPHIWEKNDLKNFF